MRAGMRATSATSSPATGVLSGSPIRPWPLTPGPLRTSALPMLLLCVTLQTDGNGWPVTTVDACLAGSLRRREGATMHPRHQVVTARRVLRCSARSSAARMRSGLEYRYRREPLEPVGAGGGHGGNAVSPPLAGAGVLHGKRAIAQQCLDPRPLASRRNTGPEVPPGLHVRRGIAPQLSCPKLGHTMQWRGFGAKSFGASQSAVVVPQLTH